MSGTLFTDHCYQHRQSTLCSSSSEILEVVASMVCSIERFHCVRMLCLEVPLSWVVVVYIENCTHLVLLLGIMVYSVMYRFYHVP